MSIPTGVVTVQVSALPSTDGNVVSSTIEITPSQDLVWSATGQRLASMCNVSPAPGWVILPAVDQAGFVTPDTHTGVTGWSYLISVSWIEEDGSSHSESGTIQCFASQTVEYLTGASGVLTPTAVYPIGGIALSGWVDTYAHLPTGLTAADAGKSFMVQSDQRMYVWSGTAWPASGQGFAASGPPGPTGSTGATGPANTLTVGSVQTGSPIAITISGSAPNQTIDFTLPEGHWWTGSGAPGTIAAALDGDIYFDNSGTGNLYQLQSGTWVSQGTIKGPTGPTGSTGSTGPRGSEWFTGAGAPGTVTGAVSGDFYLNSSNGTYYSYNGTTWTSQGSLVGPTGPTGASSTWRTGAGVPSSGLGANGDMYLNTSTGDVYGPKASGAWGSISANITGPAAPSATATTQGIIQLAGDLSGTAASPTVPGLAAKASTLTATAVKTSAYTAAVGDLIPADASGAAFTITLPTAPADKSRITVKKVDSSANAVTLACAGSDKFNTSSGPTTLTMALQNTSVTLQYTSATAIWYAVVNDTPMSSLDGRYAPIASPTFTGTPAAPTATAGTSTTQLATTAFVATSFAPLASPTFTGTPAAPSPTAGDSSTKLATTAFVATSFAPLASPALTGTPTVPTAASGTNTTQAASTAFVQTAAQVTGGTLAMKASQTANYTAAAGDFVPVSASGGAVTITLPTAPANGTRVTVMKTDTSTNAVTISRGGATDVINVAAQTSLTLSNYLSVAALEYASAAGIWYNQESSAPAHFTAMFQSGARATGYGDMPEGVYIPQALELFAVQFRIGTADASGTSAAQIYTNTTNASTGTALSGASVASAAWATANTKTLVTGPWVIAAGTYLQCNVTTVGTTPGKRLYVDCIGAWL